MRVTVLESARRSIVNGYHFYENREAGLGLYFVDSILSDLRSLEILAGLHEIFVDDYRKLISKKFPFAIYYKVENNVGVVYAVLDCRRDPEWILNQLNRSTDR